MVYGFLGHVAARSISVVQTAVRYHPNSPESPVVTWVTAHSSVVGALLLGTLYGSLVAVAPDHLGTVMTLSAGSTDTEAMRVGAAWGLGHSIGMGLIFLAFFFMERVFGRAIADWDSHSDYVVGVSMILCALYFAYKENEYIIKNDDSTETIASCPCCAPVVLKKEQPAVCVPLGQKYPNYNSTTGFRPNAGSGVSMRFGPGITSRSDMETGVNMLAPQQSSRSSSTRSGSAVTGIHPEKLCADKNGGWTWWMWNHRDMKGAVIGVVQGFCCPMCLVGASFANVLSTLPGCAAFVAAFVFSSMVVTGLLALLWSRISRSGSKWLAPKLVYRATCAFTLTLGVGWIWLNALGALDLLEWTERIERASGVGAPATA